LWNTEGRASRQTDSKDPHAVGTGGTPFMDYLKKHRDETGQNRLE
jgi:indoleamine 2,3-dioxygenase